MCAISLIPLRAGVVPCSGACLSALLTNTDFELQHTHHLFSFAQLLWPEKLSHTAYPTATGTPYLNLFTSWPGQAGWCTRDGGELTREFPS